MCKFCSENKDIALITGILLETFAMIQESSSNQNEIINKISFVIYVSENGRILHVNDFLYLTNCHQFQIQDYINWLEICSVSSS